MNTYTGELDYLDDSGDYITVERFIVRAEEISFDLVTTWGDDGDWRYSATAKRENADLFVTEQITGTPLRRGLAVKDEYASSLRFRISPGNGRALAVSGEWRYLLKTYYFSGTLDSLTS